MSTRMGIGMDGGNMSSTVGGVSAAGASPWSEAAMGRSTSSNPDGASKARMRLMTRRPLLMRGGTTMKSKAVAALHGISFMHLPFLWSWLPGDLLGLPVVEDRAAIHGC